MERRVKLSDLRETAAYCTVRDMAIIYSVSTQTIRNWCLILGLKPTGFKRLNPTWSHREDRKLTELWHEGKTASEIAGSLSGRTRDAVLGRAHRLGLPRHKKTTQGLKNGSVR